MIQLRSLALFLGLVAAAFGHVGTRLEESLRRFEVVIQKQPARDPVRRVVHKTSDGRMDVGEAAANAIGHIGSRLPEPPLEM